MGKREEAYVERIKNLPVTDRIKLKRSLYRTFDTARRDDIFLFFRTYAPFCDGDVEAFRDSNALAHMFVAALCCKYDNGGTVPFEKLLGTLYAEENPSTRADINTLFRLSWDIDGTMINQFRRLLFKLPEDEARTIDMAKLLTDIINWDDCWSEWSYEIAKSIAYSNGISE